MKLGHKLILAPVITAAVVLLAGQVDAFLLNRSADNAVARFGLDLERQAALSGARNLTSDLSVDVYRTMGIVDSLDEAGLMAKRNAVRQTTDGIAKDLTGLATHPDIVDSLRGDLEKSIQLIGEYGKRADTALDLASVDANTGIAAMQSADAVFAELAKTLASAVTESGKQATALAEDGATKADQMHLLISLASLLLASLVVGIVWQMMRKLALDLNKASWVAQQVADGNLGVEVNNTRNDEVGELFKTLRAMRDSLSNTVTQVRSATDSINTASSEIAAGNQDLSARTEHAASNLEETAASMEELTSTVSQSADAARQANQLAASASEVAVRGGQVVSQVVTTMEEINRSSQKISDIIGVIDGIAFQTNILALNAAVEAARAGEQGRGFAVVASEVRSLAQRSAEAAKEIKGLIGTSVDKVGAGTRLVAEAGQTMSEIVGSVQRVSDIIGEITAASGEQRDGIAQVNTAVNQLDQMTQQNAALVEESAAAAESLRDQAARLTQVVQVFRLAGSFQAQLPAPATKRTPALASPAPSKRVATIPAAKAVAHAAAKPAPALELKRPQATAAAPAKAAPKAVDSHKVVAKATAGDEGDWESF